MSGLEGQRDVPAAKFEAILPHLDERQRRLRIRAEARSLGHGGIRAVARAADVCEATVSLGMREPDSGETPSGRVRRAGGGRKRVVDLNPALRAALLALVEPDVRGDPMSPLRRTTESTRKLAEELTRQGHRICADTVGDLLREEGFSLQSNAKTLEGKQHPDRDARFRCLNEQARRHRNCDQPVISVDTKKPAAAPASHSSANPQVRRARRARPAGYRETGRGPPALLLNRRSAALFRGLQNRHALHMMGHRKGVDLSELRKSPVRSRFPGSLCRVRAPRASNERHGRQPAPAAQSRGGHDDQRTGRVRLGSLRRGGMPRTSGSGPWLSCGPATPDGPDDEERPVSGP
ncbi:hypothetical protein GCM10027162_12340 [Streptomyces incanus]